MFLNKMSAQDLENEAWFHQLDVVIEVILIVGSLHWCMPASVCQWLDLCQETDDPEVDDQHVLLNSVKILCRIFT